MKEVVSECNQEFGNKLETIQNQNPHDEYILEGNMASWKDILLVYTVKQSNGINQQEVITVDNTKKNNVDAYKAFKKGRIDMTLNLVEDSLEYLSYVDKQ